MSYLNTMAVLNIIFITFYCIEKTFQLYESLLLKSKIYFYVQGGVGAKLFLPLYLGHERVSNMPQQEFRCSHLMSKVNLVTIKEICCCFFPSLLLSYRILKLV